MVTYFSFWILRTGGQSQIWQWKHLDQQSWKGDNGGRKRERRARKEEIFQGRKKQRWLRSTHTKKITRTDQVKNLAFESYCFILYSLCIWIVQYAEMTSKQKIRSEMKAKPTQTAFVVALLVFTFSWFPPAPLWAEVKQGWQTCFSTEWKCWHRGPIPKCQIYLLSSPSLCLLPTSSMSQGF